MTTAFHTWPYGRFREIQSNLRRKKLHRMNQGFNFLGGRFSNRDNTRALIQFRRQSQPQFLNDFSSRTDPSIFTSIAPVLLDCSKQTGWISQHWNQQAISRVSHRCWGHGGNTSEFDGGGGIKSIHGGSMGRGLKMLSKNTCEGDHLVVKLSSISL